MAGFQPFGGATKYFVAITMAAGLIVNGILNLSGATIRTSIPDGRVLYSDNGVATGTQGTYVSSTNQFIFGNTSGTNATTTNRLYAQSIYLGNGGITAVDNSFSVAASGQLTIAYSGTAVNVVGSIRSSTGYTDATFPFNNGLKPNSGMGYKVATNQIVLGNDLQSIRISSGSAATSSLNVQYFQEGLANTSTIRYIGTGDGCGRLTYSASNTSPTLTPVPVANCNQL